MKQSINQTVNQSNHQSVPINQSNNQSIKQSWHLTLCDFHARKITTSFHNKSILRWYIVHTILNSHFQVCLTDGQYDVNAYMCSLNQLMHHC